MFKLKFKSMLLLSAAALTAALTGALGVYGLTKYIKKAGTRGLMRGIGTVMYTVGATVRTLASEPATAVVPSSK